MSLTREQSLVVARQALFSGNPVLARAIASALLQGNNADPYALLIISVAETQLGNPGGGHVAGRAAWRSARGMQDGLRYDIARQTAVAAMRGGRVFPMQFWLRRALDVAPTPETRAQTIADYRAVRERTKLKLSFSMSVTPSDNLNSGASGNLLIIDDRFLLGRLTGSAQALSGVRTEVEGGLTYRILTTAKTATDIGLRLSFADYRLSTEARLQAPDITSSNLDTARAEANISSKFLWPGLNRPGRVGLAAGYIKEGRADPAPFLRLEASGQLVSNERWMLSVKAAGQRNWLNSDAVTAMTLGVEGSVLVGQGVLGLGLSVSDARGDAANQDRRRTSLQIAYSHTRPLGPVSLSTGVMAAVTDYPTYLLGPVAVTKGREDRQQGIFVNMVFQDLGVMGYAPSLTLSNTRTSSNISRFSGSETSVSIGIKSQF
ncbi:MAG: hypothetical protein V4712_10540 [Pseudomonadota bacterium]